MLALIAFAIQTGFTAQYHASWQSNPNIWVPPSSQISWYNLHTPRTYWLMYRGPNAPHSDVRAEVNDDAYGPLVRQANIQGYYPSDIKNAYTFTPGGANAICLVDYGHLPTSLGDFNTFSAQFGLPQETSSDPTAATNKVFQVVYETGAVPPSNVANGWGGEEALDIEWAHAMAPKAKIYVVESSTGDLDQDNQIAAALPGVKEVSNSWGYPGEAGSGELQLDKYYVYNGVVFFASCGDIGALQSYPAESPNVVGAGGTSLVMNSTGTRVVSESGWIDGGGGPSQYELRPPFQSVPGVAKIVGGVRGDPDMSAVADPDTGVAVYSSSYGGWFVVGGTSVSSPLLAGLVNSSGTFYANSQTEENLIYGRLQTADFRDITTGSSTDGVTTYNCTVGWDFVTGCGSPLNLTKPLISYNGNLTSASSVTGKNASGGVPALESIDQVYYAVTGVVFPGLGSTADVRASFVVSGADASPSLAAGGTITVTAKANYPNIINQIFVYNAKTKTYDLLATPLLTTGEQTFTVTLSAAQAPNYIDSNGNVIVLSRALLAQNMFQGANTGFLYSVDQISVNYQFSQQGPGGG